VDGRSVTDVTKCTFCGKCVEECAAGAREFVGRRVSADDVMAEIERDVVFYDQSSGGVTFSGGEPLMQPEFLCELLSRCKLHDMRTTVDTSCYAEPDVLETVRETTDLFLCDIKHMDSKTHERFTGAPNELILDNIRWLASAGANIILRIPLIPGFNDAESNIEACGRFAASLGCVDRIDVLPYNSGGIEKAARLSVHRELMKSEPPTDEKLEAVKNALQRFGFEVKMRG
jgi:pyruvate formate lyase activating enzyme